MKTRQIIVCGFLTVILALAFTTCDNDTDDGSNSDYWKITWNLDGGTFASGSNHPTQIEKDAVLAKPSPDPTKDGNPFGGWYANSGLTQAYNFASPVTADLNLYAKWNPPPVEITVTAGSTLAEKLKWVEDNAQSNAIYFIKVNDDESIASSQSLSYTNKSGITIHLEGIDGEKIISLSSKGPLFTLYTATLILDNNITLQGISDKSSALVMIMSGTFEMRKGAKISGGTSWTGGGIAVSSNGTFTMNGGEISNNSASIHGGGVYVENGGTFIMNDGKISDNNGGQTGGGVEVFGTFTMNGGVISGNATVSYFGGGIYVGHSTNSIFTMNGGEISGNTASSFGGGVFVGGIFTMKGGEISGNTVQAGLSSSGGGVYIGTDAFFRIVTGTVYGSNESNTSLRNTANDGGAALHMSTISTPVGTAQYGTFSGETWTSAGDLSTTNDTIKVVNGVLQE